MNKDIYRRKVDCNSSKLQREAGELTEARKLNKLKGNTQQLAGLLPGSVMVWQKDQAGKKLKHLISSKLEG